MVTKSKFYNKVNFANPKFPFLDLLDVDQDVRMRLSNLLISTIKGNDEIYTSPYLAERDPKVVLSEWDSIYKKNKSAINDNLDKLEMSNRDKFGPRSIAVPWVDRKQSVYQYFEIVPSSASLSLGRKYGRLRPISKEKALSYLKNDTNSGLPFFKRKSIIKDRLIPEFKELLNRQDPCILFTRTQEGGKTRTVFGFPVIDTLNEMMYYRPILDFQKKLPWRAALRSREELDASIFRMINSLKDGEILISVDFTAYDASVSKLLIENAFEYFKSLYQSSYHKELDYIRDRILTIGLVTPDGILSGDRAIKSGSTFTNELGSVIQFQVSQTSLNNFTEFDCQIQGDDGAYKIRSSDKDDFFAAFIKAGLGVNESKSYTSREYIIYLQNLFDKFYFDKGIVGGIYPVYRALNRVLYQERWNDFEDYGLSGKDYYALRTISILENCKFHPLFEEIVKYVAKLEKYTLLPSDEGLLAYVNMMSSKQSLSEQFTNQFGDNFKGIKSFETYKLVKRLKL